MKRGVFIVFEGADGTGKTTQVKRLVERLCSQGHKTEAMRFPERTTAIGQMINDYLQCKKELSDEAVHLLFSANRWELEKTIKSTLLSGTNIICDRYAFSGVAFTSAKPGFSLDWCKGPDRGLPLPDKVFYLKASEELARSRGDFGTERYETNDFQSTVQKRFELLQSCSDSTVWDIQTVTNGIEETTDHLYSLVMQCLKEERGELGKLWT